VRHIEKVGPESKLTGRLKHNVRQLMKKQYTHLTQEERYHIHAYKKAGFSALFIANELNRHVSTIKRELVRNQGLRDYRPDQAHAMAQNRHAIKPKALKMTPEIIKQIKCGLKQQWSPEQIQGRLLEQNISAVCPKTIYDFV
jgi:transposase, IS30 family